MLGHSSIGFDHPIREDLYRSLFRPIQSHRFMPPNQDAVTYLVKLRGISADFSKIGESIEEQELGPLSAEALIELLEKFAALDPLRLVESEPAVLITGRRGRFTTQNNQGKLTLRPSGDPLAIFSEMKASEIPEWLDQSERPAVTAGSAPTVDERDILIIKVKPARMNLITLMMASSLLILVLTTYLSYQPAPLNDERDYLTIDEPEQVSSYLKKSIGHYANTDKSVTIKVRDDRQLELTETDGPQNEHREVSTYPYTLMSNQTGQPVLFSPAGVITVAEGKSLSYNGDIYYRLTNPSQDL